MTMLNIGLRRIGLHESKSSSLSLQAILKPCPRLLNFLVAEKLAFLEEQD